MSTDEHSEQDAGEQPETNPEQEQEKSGSVAYQDVLPDAQVADAEVAMEKRASHWASASDRTTAITKTVPLLGPEQKEDTPSERPEDGGSDPSGNDSGGQEEE